MVNPNALPHPPSFDHDYLWLPTAGAGGAHLRWVGWRDGHCHLLGVHNILVGLRATVLKTISICGRHWSGTTYTLADLDQAVVWEGITFLPFRFSWKHPLCEGCFPKNEKGSLTVPVGHARRFVQGLVGDTNLASQIAHGRAVLQAEWEKMLRDYDQDLQTYNWGSLDLRPLLSQPDLTFESALILDACALGGHDPASLVRAWGETTGHDPGPLLDLWETIANG